MTAMHNNFFAGEWVGSDAGMDNISPSDLSDVIGCYAQASDHQTEQAITAASEAFPVWSCSGIQQRSDSLDFIGSELLARKNELGRLLAREEGKTLAEGIGEVTRAGQIFKFYAGEVLRIQGKYCASVRVGVDIDVVREPLGVVALITPWNFPIAIPAWKIAPALAFGNCVVFKPASLVPGCAWALSEIISRAGLPAGVFNLLMGSGTVVGQQLINSPLVNGVSFTGSDTTGAAVAVACSARGAKYQLEMGGKNPLLVLDDANIEVAVACAINGAYFSTGQRCTASSRLIVSKGIYTQFTETLAASISALQVGHALDDNTDIGPVIDQRQFEQNIEYIKIGQSEGAQLMCGGDRVECSTQGYFFSPALFLNTDNNMRINQEEIFGPIATVIEVDDFEQALACANDTGFGLSAGICTTSLQYAHQFKRRICAGMVMVNLPTAGVDYHVPFGGVKGSSYGSREQGSEAVEFYTQLKTTYWSFA